MKGILLELVIFLDKQKFFNSFLGDTIADTNTYKDIQETIRKAKQVEKF